MKLLIFNDPHRGFDHNTAKIQDKVLSKIDHNSFDIIAVVGDWGADKLENVENCFKAFRKAFPTKKIIGVIGNHDLWDKTNKSILYKFEKISEFSKKYDIHLLENNPFEKDNFLFLGFNGWYHHPHFDTKDSMYMYQYVEGGTPVDNYLRNLADKAVNFMIDYPKENKKVISITHFPCILEAMDKPQWNGNPAHGDILLEFSDLILFGHTHVALDLEIKGKRVINVGSGYNELKYKIVDLAKL